MNLNSTGFKIFAKIMRGNCVFVVQITLALTLQATLSLKKIESYMFFSTVCSSFTGFKCILQKLSAK